MTDTRLAPAESCLSDQELAMTGGSKPRSNKGYLCDGWFFAIERSVERRKRIEAALASKAKWVPNPYEGQRLIITSFNGVTGHRPRSSDYKPSIAAFRRR